MSGDGQLDSRQRCRGAAGIAGPSATKPPARRSTPPSATAASAERSAARRWWLFSAKLPAFRILVGRPVRYRSTAQAWCTFCGTCGTQLTFQRDGSGEIDITTCSLDDPEAVPPQDQTYTRSRLRWAAGIVSLPGHPTLRPMRQSGP